MDKRLHKASLVLVVIGIIVSIYMTIYKLTDNNAMCLGNGGCSVVNTSKYSEIYGIPVALVGVGGYAAILLWHLLEKRTEFLRQNATLFIFGLALAGFLFTLYLVYVEFAILKALCPFCLTSQAAMTIIFVISIVRLVRQPQSQED
ncbi:MAG: hypothetical protein A3K45_05160 [Chloroflexi bacterium RIFOXYC12_FULL_59_14]|nr:MAG: hypothetical protein A3K45_05160 [Chloroflexi bacterium RIFOXYC12_FULL_59_14]